MTTHCGLVKIHMFQGVRCPLECTLPQGHLGNHAAYGTEKIENGTQGTLISTWAQEPSVALSNEAIRWRDLYYKTYNNYERLESELTFVVSEMKDIGHKLSARCARLQLVLNDIKEKK